MKHLWIYLGFGLLIVVFGAFVSLKVASIFAGVVPPISGRLVDVISGKPVPGMNVCLEAAVIDWQTREVVRSELTRSDASGEFSFSSSIHRTAGFQRWEGYSLRITDPNEDMVPACGETSDAQFWNFISGLDRGRTWSPIDSGKPVYFPVTVVSHPTPHGAPLGPLHREMKHFWGGEIALIPLLPNATECQGIRDLSLAAYCKEMNISAAASTLRRAIQQSAKTN